ncbi:hypothetical protein ABTZ44_15565 [Microbacterium oxydans]|uniref:hypothetical protein n=1 Tax=Microbacterium TaxID=33882 RepID=UPI00187D3416|nr:hypothetical protein [Microbacterium sp. R1]MBE7955228.1 hypothetical protein [Microbacterium sp. R1]
MDWSEEVKHAREASDYRSVAAAIKRGVDEVGSDHAAVLLESEFSVEGLKSIHDAETDADAVYLLGVELWGHSVGQLEAVVALREAESLGSEEAVAFLGDVLSSFGAHEEAIGFLRRARDRRYGNRAWVAGLLGASLYELGETGDEVEELLREGAEVFADFGVDYAKALRARGADDEAAVVLRPLVADGVYGAALQLGNLLSDNSDIEGAVEAYLKGVESKDGHSALNLAILYHEEGQDADSRYYKLVARDLGDMTEWSDE